MKKLFILILILIIQTNFCSAQDNYKYLNCAKDFQNYMASLYNYRAVVYNSLDLDECQKDKIENILNKNLDIYKNKFNDLMTESAKLDAFKLSNIGVKSEYQQLKKMNFSKKDILKLLSNEDNEIRKILTRRQRRTYRIIRHLEKTDYKRALHEKNYHKKNPSLPSFGKI